MDMSIFEQAAEIIVQVCIWCLDNIIFPIYEYVIRYIIEMFAG